MDGEDSKSYLENLSAKLGKDVTQMRDPEPEVAEIWGGKIPKPEKKKLRLAVASYLFRTDPLSREEIARFHHLDVKKFYDTFCVFRLVVDGRFSGNAVAVFVPKDFHIPNVIAKVKKAMAYKKDPEVKKIKGAYLDIVFRTKRVGDLDGFIEAAPYKVVKDLGDYVPNIKSSENWQTLPGLMKHVGKFQLFAAEARKCLVAIYVTEDDVKTGRILKRAYKLLCKFDESSRGRPWTVYPDDGAAYVDVARLTRAFKKRKRFGRSWIYVDMTHVNEGPIILQ